MIYVNILSGYNQLFIHQLDKRRYEGYIEFHENSIENRLWDYVVVYEIIRNDIPICCKKGGLIFMSGEPEDSSPYCRKFLDQFDHIISSLKWYKRPTLINSQTALNYHYGRSFSSGRYKYDFEKLSSLPIPEKRKNISMICSTKTMLPGHVLRINLYKALKSRLNDKIDFFGDGIKRVDDKAESIDSYKFHICIENSSVDDYWTEKISDSLLGYSIPIYYGAPNIYDYFPKDSVIWLDINDTEKAVNQIEMILANADAIYEEMFPALLKARKLLLNKYNIFPTIENIIKKYPNVELGENHNIIRTYLNMKKYKVRMLKLRLRRYIFKHFHK